MGRKGGIDPAEADWSDAWIEVDAGERWRSASALGASTGAAAMSCSLLEVPAGGVLPRHVDSAEETIVVVAGHAEVTVGDQPAEQLPAGGVALVPEGVPHTVGSIGPEDLRFVAVYAAPEVITTYERPVQPDGERERQSAS